MLSLTGDTPLARTQETSAEAEGTAEEEDDRRPGIYENCKYAELVTGLTFYEGDPEGGHFGVRSGRAGRKGDIAYTVKTGRVGKYLQAYSLFVCLSRGYVQSGTIPREGFPLKGRTRTLQDGTVVVFRHLTGSLGSPAVEVQHPATPAVARQKVHFATG